MTWIGGNNVTQSQHNSQHRGVNTSNQPRDVDTTWQFETKLLQKSCHNSTWLESISIQSRVFYIFHSGCRQHVGNTTQIVQPIQTVGVCLVEGERGFSRLTPMAGSTDWKTAFNTRNVWLPRTAFENSHVGYVNRSNFWTNLKDCLNIPWCEYFSKVEHKLNLSETVWMFEEPTSQIEFLSDFLWSLAHGIWSHTLTSVTSVTSDLL